MQLHQDRSLNNAETLPNPETEVGQPHSGGRIQQAAVIDGLKMKPNISFSLTLEAVEMRQEPDN